MWQCVERTSGEMHTCRVESAIVLGSARERGTDGAILRLNGNNIQIYYMIIECETHQTHRNCSPLWLRFIASYSCAVELIGPIRPNVTILMICCLPLPTVANGLNCRWHYPLSRIVYQFQISSIVCHEV